MVRLGIVTPVLIRLPRAHAAWEATAGIDEVEHVVAAAERLGYEFATCSEHVAIPRDVAATRGATYWDPLPTFGYLAAHTTTIQFATFVLFFPFTFLTTAFVPQVALASWMSTVADYNPVTYLLGGLRSLESVGWQGSALWPCLVAIGCVFAVSMSLSLWALRSRTDPG